MVCKQFLEHNRLVGISPPGILIFSRTECLDDKTPRPFRISLLSVSQLKPHHASRAKDGLTLYVFWHLRLTLPCLA